MYINNQQQKVHAVRPDRPSSQRPPQRDPDWSARVSVTSAGAGSGESSQCSSSRLCIDAAGSPLFRLNKRGRRAKYTSPLLKDDSADVTRLQLSTFLLYCFCFCCCCCCHCLPQLHTDSKRHWASLVHFAAVIVRPCRQPRLVGKQDSDPGGEDSLWRIDAPVSVV